MFNECTQHPNLCCRSDKCGIRGIWVEAESYLRNFFRDKSLAEVITNYEVCGHNEGVHGSAVDPIRTSELQDNAANPKN